jgi:hypothetical protein
LTLGASRADAAVAAGRELDLDAAVQLGLEICGET